MLYFCFSPVRKGRGEGETEKEYGEMKNLGLYNEELSVPRKEDVPQPSDDTPNGPGVASAGSENAYARWDHVHSKELPTVTTSDDGKFLRVVSGAWAAVEIANANGGSF